MSERMNGNSHIHEHKCTLQTWCFDDDDDADFNCAHFSDMLHLFSAWYRDSHFYRCLHFTLFALVQMWGGYGKTICSLASYKRRGKKLRIWYILACMSMHVCNSNKWLWRPTDRASESGRQQEKENCIKQPKWMTFMMMINVGENVLIKCTL